MRPHRFLLTLLTSVLAFLLLVHILPSHSAEQLDLEESSRLGAYFNWRTPSSLFPPSAIISLTDDNSTFFLARPAAFGPLLPSKSLTGQLWIGSGFDLDEHGRVGAGVYGAEGELGCSDVPGWNGGDGRGGMRNGVDATTSDAQREGAKGKRASDAEGDDGDAHAQPSEDDGTDDHLHHPLPPSDALQTARGKSKKPAHADIQSLQESAEIAGKIVLLSRGGCGFLEKVKWVQRRGGVALIVGDDIRGGPLVTMYARGDTSNVTIPSLFTSHTTAHLLSSLMPSGGNVEDVAFEDATRLGLVAGGDRGEADRNGGNKHTATAAASKTMSTRRPRKDMHNASPLRDREGKLEGMKVDDKEVGWFRSLFRDNDDGDGDSRRPPSSGKLDWILQEEFEDDLPRNLDHRHGANLASTAPKRHATSSSTKTYQTDGFQIGVQDWRDPDLVAEQKEQLARGTASETGSSSATGSHNTNPTASSSARGSITPGSGEYGQAPSGRPAGVSRSGRAQNGSKPSREEAKGHDGGWLARLFGWHTSEQSVASESAAEKADKTSPDHSGRAPAMHYDERPSTVDDSGEHEGLWVTLTPTSMSSSPFFDTLLVLVVSPLVTLTVVYALLLLRTRIRRRRWRAPKSLVERLPVRTYQTMPSSTTSSTTSSTGSPATATTPLLPSVQRQASRPISAQPRPRSRTAGDIAAQSSSLRSDATTPTPSLDQIEEKRAAGLAEWRRRYGGKQRECVVCLEEYIDGVSRVMSLPCGHEFHEGCITPWLTTRRRTCPICKGDVVRSLARSSYNSAVANSSSPPIHEPYRDDPQDEDQVQEQAAMTHNDDPASHLPVSREDEAFEDLESGVVDRNR